MSPCRKDDRVVSLLKIPKTSTIYRWICPECNEAREGKAARGFVICGPCKLSFDTTGPLTLESFENWTTFPPDAVLLGRIHDDADRGRWEAVANWASILQWREEQQ